MRTPAAENARATALPFFHQSWLPSTAYTGLRAVNGFRCWAMVSGGT
jgi:hypothetical protein